MSTTPARIAPHQRHDHTIQKVEGGFPHSEIPGSKLVRSSPRLIAAYHVLHRLSAPRHPPNALKTLDRSHDRCPLTGNRYCGSGRRHGQKNKKTDSTDPFGPANLMLAEHNRCRPALAAATATFPLNDVVHLLSRRSQLDLSGSKTLCFPDRTKPTRSHSTLDPQGERNGGASRDRTDDLMLAKQPLSQLSYGPKL